MLNPRLVLDIIKGQLQPISQWLDDPYVTEIMINPGGNVFVECKSELIFAGKLLSESAISSVIKSLGKLNNKDAIQGEKNSMVNASLENFRICGGLMPVSPDGSFMTIRKHQAKGSRPTLKQLVEDFHALTQEQADLIFKLMIVDRQNTLFAGNTGSGKTTLANAILSLLPRQERVLSIEDTRELEINVDNYIPLVSNVDSGIDTRSLVQLANRSRADRLILGETKGEETYDLIRAFCSGHPGSMCTLHADSAEGVLTAMEMMIQMSLPKDVSLPANLIQEYITKAIKVIVYMERNYELIEAKTIVVRNVKQVCLLKGIKNGEYVLERIG